MLDGVLSCPYKPFKGLAKGFPLDILCKPFAKALTQVLEKLCSAKGLQRFRSFLGCSKKLKVRFIVFICRTFARKLRKPFGQEKLCKTFAHKVLAQSFGKDFVCKPLLENFSRMLCKLFVQRLCKFYLV